MKTYKLILIAAVGFITLGILSSCQSKLEEVAPQNSLSLQTALSDPGAMQTLYSGVYSRLRAYNGTLFILGEMRSDIWVDGLYTESGNGGYIQYYDQDIHEVNAPAGNWASFYNLIYQINNVINLLPQSKVSKEQSDKELAEMYGLRAYIYYTMLKTWGAVPLVTEPIKSISTPKETFQARTSADSVMAQIKSDIEESLSLNSDLTIPSGIRAYWNPVATLTLKGDAYIWSGTLMNGGQQDLQTALTALQKVEAIQGPTLQLDANYSDIFDPSKKADNPEIIFALNYELNQAQNGVFGNFRVNSISAKTLTFAQNNDPDENVSNVYPNVGGANRIGMNADMIARLTSGPADQRISNTFRIMYRDNAPYPVAGIMLTKYIGEVSGTNQVYDNDYPIYRYADVLLLIAEAKAKLGQDPSPEINKIRERAYGTNYTHYVNSSLKDNMDAILNEGLREFIGEGKRWWSLRRAGDQYVFDNIDSKYLSPATVASGNGPTLELPITLGMLNNNPLLKQTPGY